MHSPKTLGVASIGVRFTSRDRRGKGDQDRSVAQWFRCVAFAHFFMETHCDEERRSHYEFPCPYCKSVAHASFAPAHYIALGWRYEGEAYWEDENVYLTGHQRDDALKAVRDALSGTKESRPRRHAKPVAI